jgi:hypothetical protein
MSIVTVPRFVRWLRMSLVLATAVTFCAWAILFGINLRERFQAQSVLVAIRSMQVGTTTLEQARPILAAHHAETFSAAFTGQYSADIGFAMLFPTRTIAMLGERFYFLRYVGLASWWAGTEMYFRDGTLCVLRFSMETETTKTYQFREGYHLQTTASSERKTEFMMSGGAMDGGYFRRVHAITLPADTTPDERTHALAYDLSCVTRLGGCRDLLQIMSYQLFCQDYAARQRKP